jgi:hypothetical protein
MAFDLPLHFAFGQRRDQLVLQLIDAIVAFELAANLHRFAERHVDLLFDLAIELRPDFLFRDGQLRLAGGLRQVVDGVDDLPDRVVCGLERLDDFFLARFLGAGLDHHQAVLAAGDRDIEFAALPLIVGRVDHVLAVDQADADTRDRGVKRNLRQR